MAYASLQDRLHKDIAKNVAKELKIKNTHAVPQIEKVVVSVGINKSKMDSKEMLEYINETLALITGQQPVFTKAKKAISNFKTRENMIIGAKVTLRGKAMAEFLDRLLSYSLPRVRDFRGLTTKLDGHGNYSIGIRDHSIFPEVPPPDARQIFGVQVQIKTTTDSDDEALVLLRELGVPFRGKQEEVKEQEEEAKKQAELEAKKAAEEEATEEVAPPADDASESEEKADENVEDKSDSPDTQ